MVYNCPQIQIQSDTLQVVLENGNLGSNNEKAESIWIRINDKTFNLTSSSIKKLIDEDNDLKLIQVENETAIYNFQYKDFSHFNLIFPYSHSIFNSDNNNSYNLTSICCLDDKIMIGNSSGDLLKFNNPIPINITKYIEKKNAHWADITKIMSFSSGIVLLTVGLDMQIKIWQNDTDNSEFNEPVRILKGVHKNRITDCLTIGKGRNIVTCGLDGLIVIWELGSGKSVWKGRRLRDLNDKYTCLSITEFESTNETPVKDNITNNKVIDNNEFFFECNNKIIWCGHTSGFVSIWNLSNRLMLGEFITNDDGFQVEKIKSINNSNDLIVGLSNGNIIKFNYNFNEKILNKIWEVNVEKSEIKDLDINIKKIEIFKNSVIILTDNSLVRLNLTNGELIDIFVGYDEIINDFSINDNHLFVIGKRSFISVFKIIQN